MGFGKIEQPRGRTKVSLSINHDVIPRHDLILPTSKETGLDVLYIVQGFTVIALMLLKL